MLQRGADINLQDSNGFTALMNAAFSNHPTIVLSGGSLLRAGSDTTLREENVAGDREG